MGKKVLMETGVEWGEYLLRYKRNHWCILDFGVNIFKGLAGEAR